MGEEGGGKGGCFFSPGCFWLMLCASRQQVLGCVTADLAADSLGGEVGQRAVSRRRCTATSPLPPGSSGELVALPDISRAGTWLLSPPPQQQQRGHMTRLCSISSSQPSCTLRGGSWVCVLEKKIPLSLNEAWTLVVPCLRSPLCTDIVTDEQRWRREKRPRKNSLATVCVLARAACRGWESQQIKSHFKVSLIYADYITWGMLRNSLAICLRERLEAGEKQETAKMGTAALKNYFFFTK